MNEAKKGVRKPIYSVKTKNPVAKAHQTIGTGSGLHKDKKKAVKQGEVKHKNKEYAEHLEYSLKNKLQEHSVAEDGFDDAEYNDEAGMIKNNLHTIVRCAYELDKAINNDENLPEWVEEKISIAKGMVVTALDYIKSQHEMGVEPTQETTALDQYRQRSAKSDAEFAKREAERKKNPGSTLEPILQKLEKRYQPKEGIAGGSQQGIPEANVRDIIWKMFKIDAPTAQEALNLAVREVAQRLKANPNSRMLHQIMGDLEAIASRARIRVTSPKLENIDHTDTMLESKRRMSRAAKGYKKFGPEGMKKLAQAGKDGASEKEMDAIRNKYNKYDEDLKDPKDNPCWKGYKPVGTKKKNNRTVPNCVPKEGWTHDTLADQLFEHERTYEDKLYNLLNKKLGK